MVYTAERRHPPKPRIREMAADDRKRDRGKGGVRVAPDKLKFKVAPHIVEDLGLNLYSNLPRVLVEYIANAYDADAKTSKITFDKDAIHAAREEMKKAYEDEKGKK